MAEESKKNIENNKSKETTLPALNQQLKAAEQALRKSRLRYKAMFENTIDAIAVYERVNNKKDFILKNLNPSAENLEKLKKEDTLGKSILDILPQAGESGLLEVLQRVSESGKAEHHLITKQDDEQIASWREYHVFRLPTGEIVTAYNDITERKRAEKALADERNLLRILMDNLPDSIYVKDTKSRFVIGNAAVAQRLGAETPDDIIGKRDLDFFPKELAERYYADEQKIIQTGKPLLNREEQVINQTTGEEICNLTSKVPLRDSSGKIVGIVGIGRNITDRKRIEQQLRTLNQQLIASEQQLRASNQQLNAANQQLEADEQQLRALNQQLNAANQQLKAGEQQLKASNQQLNATNQQLRAGEEKLLDYQKQLRHLASQLSLTEERERRKIAIALHDDVLQTLVLIKMNLEQMSGILNTPDSIKITEKMKDFVDDLIHKTRSLTFDLSSPILHEVGLESAIRGWLAREIEQKHGLATKFEDDGKLKPLEDDLLMQLFRSVREALLNVVRHAQAKKVKVSIKKDTDIVTIIVQDDGVGFAASENTFSYEKTEGFGLFSIRECLNPFGATMNIESQPGKGTKFILTAPLKKNKPAENKGNTI